MPSGRAHDEALPLVALIRHLDGVGPLDATSAIQGYLDSRFLWTDIQPVIAFADGDRKVQLEPITDFGEELLQEVFAATEFSPCPEGECEFSGKACVWCGSMQP